MYDIIIRKATSSDLEQLYAFEQGIIQAEHSFDSFKESPIHYYDLIQMMNSPHIELVIAAWNGKDIGCGYARIESSKPYLKHQQHAYLGFMYVLPEFRGQGVNKKIIQYLIEWAGGNKVYEIRLEVYFGNISAIRAYEKIGFVKHMIEMRISSDA